MINCVIIYVLSKLENKMDKFINNIVSMVNMFRWTAVIEILLIAVLIYNLIIWIQKTKAWVILKGILFIVIIAIIATILKLNVILWFYRNTLSIGITAILILFQPELRKALEQLGKRNIVFSFIQIESEKKEETISEQSILEIVESLFVMSPVKTGALIVIERSINLSDIEKTGIPINARITKELLVNIFEKNTPLHDGAVVIRNNEIVAATCYLPLSTNDKISKELGTRHRAAIGITEETDAVVLIVSEETGKISISQSGRIFMGLDKQALIKKMNTLLLKKDEVKNSKLWWKEKMINGKK